MKATLSGQVYFAGVCVAVLLTAAPISAHHSSAIYQDDEVALRGTVASVTWRNPHVLLHWDVTDRDGKVVRWIGEMPSVSSLQSEGFLRNAIMPGQELILLVRPARAGTPESVIGAIVRPDGTVVRGWSPQGGGTDEDVSRRRALARVKLLEPFGLKVNP